jgi:probable F420-dependent oxidoreductase
MRFGLCLANVGTYADPRTVVALAEDAESAGWEALLVWDHLGFVWGPPAADPWVTLAAVAARTSSLLLGTNVTPVPRRRPHVLAHQVATLDVLSGGRVVLGVGIGGIVSEFTSFGEEADARVRAEMLDEGLEVLRALWSGARVDHHGRHYTVDGVTLAPGPVQARLPIWVGGNSAPALRRAARHDGWAANTTDPQGMTMTAGDVARSVETIRALREAADPFDVVVMGHVERGDRETPAAYAEAGATWWLENIHDVRGNLDEMLGLVRSGPPR